MPTFSEQTLRIFETPVLLRAPGFCFFSTSSARIAAKREDLEQKHAKLRNLQTCRIGWRINMGQGQVNTKMDEACGT